MKIAKHDFWNFRKTFKSCSTFIIAISSIALFCHDTLKTLQLHKNIAKGLLTYIFKKMILIKKNEQRNLFAVIVFLKSKKKSIYFLNNGIH